MDQRFQIDLRGIIDLLSNHLYSGPQVYVRELLQNAVDAIRARRHLDPAHEGRIEMEVSEASLRISDDGIGLTEDEIHRFLATIGESSKRAVDGELAEQRTEFIGQFGIGLLSCFLVSDEIVVRTRSARGGPAIEWRGRQDGTYSWEPLPDDLPAGTTVLVRAREGCEEWLAAERVRDLARDYGELLPIPIELREGDSSQRLDLGGKPWRDREVDLLQYGERLFGMPMMDWIPLSSEAGGVEGVAFVLPHSPSPAARPAHRVYLKGMLLTERADNLLPDWAFFVRCVVNAEGLRPTASRESFYEDDILSDARERLGLTLRAWLMHLSKSDPERLRRLIAVHHLTIKGLAVHDDEFFEIFIDWIPFETSAGVMPLGEYRRRSGTVRYAPSMDHFRQIAPVATSQGMVIINAAYTHDRDLLEKLGTLNPELEVELIDAAVFTDALEDLSVEEREHLYDLLKTAARVLAPHEVEVEAKKFFPEELPTFYSTTSEGDFLREVERTREVSGALWSSVLDSLSQTVDAPSARLCFNYRNPLIRKLATVDDPNLLEMLLQMLYVQALLLGHHPLRSSEMELLNRGLLGLVEWSLLTHGGGLLQ